MTEELRLFALFAWIAFKYLIHAEWMTLFAKGEYVSEWHNSYKLVPGIWQPRTRRND